MDAMIQWTDTPPKRHHLIYWEGATTRQITFENPQGLTTTSFAQKFDDGWLIVAARGGLARVFDNQQKLVRSLDLSDGIEHVNTTAESHIWVGYFDEGVYGGSGIGSEGLVCFDAAGRPIFKYAEFAEKEKLPHIDDCYSLMFPGRRSISLITQTFLWFG
jgi:hypothetical protein